MAMVKNAKHILLINQNSGYSIHFATNGPNTALLYVLTLAVCCHHHGDDQHPARATCHSDHWQCVILNCELFTTETNYTYRKNNDIKSKAPVQAFLKGFCFPLY